ncbi:PAS domain S-box protein [Cerasicoccus maritimus]|uniref:PAS domain S-box protein n=1 Tax=Cerasicoccus maritimus TaxID=490089 RepID=UPI00285251F9|nr:PAS domain S-box protein [Cerasicoccus maritimus]
MLKHGEDYVSIVRILLLVDRTSERSGIQRALLEFEPSLIEIEVAETLADALRTIEHDSSDVVVLDFDLWKLASQADREALTPLQIPIVILVEPGEAEAAMRAIGSEKRAYLSKGAYSEAQLRSEIQRAMAYQCQSESDEAEVTDEGGQPLGSLENLICQLFKSFTDGVVILDQKNTVLCANPKFQTMLGISLADLVGKRAPQGIVRNSDQEIQIQRQDGSRCHLEVFSSEIKWNRAPAYLVTLRDITQSKHNNLELRLFRTLIDHSSDALEILDEDGHFLDMNKTGLERLGYTLEEIRNLRIHDVEESLTDDEWRQRMHDLKSAYRRGLFRTLTEVHVKKSGEAFPVEVSVSYVDLDQPYLVAVVRDITERKKNEVLLKRDAEILSRLHSAIVVCNPDHEIIYWNEVTLSLFNRTAKEIMSLQLMDLVSRDGASQIQDCFRQIALGKNAESQFELKIKGQHIWLGVHAYSYEDDGVGKCSSIFVFTDLTKHKDLEQQLMQAQKMEAIGTLAGGIAHDFNNIMGAIRGFSELALRRAGDQASRDYLERVVSSSERATSLIDKILTFSRKHTDVRYRIQPAEMVRESTDLLRATIPTTINVQLDIQDTRSQIEICPDHIQQIILNLGTNAFHALEERLGTLSVELKKVDLTLEEVSLPMNIPPGAYLCLSVSDTGAGIPPSVKERIFEPFFTTKEQGKGTGLGLSTVHGIVQQSHGAIKVESEVGVGTTFSCFFPIVDCGGAEMKSAPMLDLPGQGERVLLVDDEMTLLLLGREMLSDLGYEVELCSDSIEALSVVMNAANPFDLIITDQTMPRMTGLELAKEIHIRLPQQKIIIATGYSSTLTLEKAREAGVSVIIKKPQSISQLSQVLRDVLQGEITEPRFYPHIA